MSRIETPFAVSSNDGEWCFHGDNLADAIQEAVTYWLDRADCEKLPESIGLLVYTDCVWCDGEEHHDGEDWTNDCVCGGYHDDDEWLLFDWKSRETRAYMLTDEDRELWE